MNFGAFTASGEIVCGSPISAPQSLNHQCLCTCHGEPVFVPDADIALCQRLATAAGGNLEQTGGMCHWVAWYRGDGQIAISTGRHHVDLAFEPISVEIFKTENHLLDGISRTILFEDEQDAITFLTSWVAKL